MLARGLRRPSDRRIAGNGRGRSRRLGRPVETLLFHDLDEVEAYDGVWANACLLHVPRDELAQRPGADLARAEARRACSTPASRPATATAAIRSIATTIIRRRTGCAPPTPSAGELEFAVDRAPAKSEASTTNDGDDAVRRRLARARRELIAPRHAQSTLKIASASTACARKPTVKASVRNTGRPSV